MMPEVPQELLSRVDTLAKILWNYHQLHHQVTGSDAIFVMGSSDVRVAERGIQLFLDGYAPLLVLSGGVGKFSRDKFSQPEANVFAEKAIAKGVPEKAILIENKSTNTGENVRFTYELLQQQGISLNKILLVQKPYMERRAYATVKKQWPNPVTEFTVTSPEIDYEDYFTAQLPKDLVINIMVGDTQRIREYPQLGYQIEQEIPNEVWATYQELVSLGYNNHLV